MDNLKSPAFAQQIILHPIDNKPFAAGQMVEGAEGFTKLEYAALMIGQGMVSNPIYHSHTGQQIAAKSLSFAMSILEEANKENHHK